LLTGLYAMATAEHREPCDSRGSCTVLGAPGGETPSGDSSFWDQIGCCTIGRLFVRSPCMSWRSAPCARRARLACAFR